MFRDNTKSEQSKDKAVSPVVGVILMVAITVILAAVVGTYVLDLGGDIGSNAQAGISFDQGESGNVTVTIITKGQNTAGVFVDGSQIVGSDSTSDVGDSLEVSASSGDRLEVVAETDGGKRTVIQTYEVR